MNSIDKEINNMIMREIGLEVGGGQRIIDQDTGMLITFRGMNLMAPGCYGGSRSIEFDPYNNKRLMNHLFGYFLDKHSDESDVYVSTFYDVNDGDKSKVTCKLSDNTEITSKSYTRESLKYVDIVAQLNGDDSPNLQKYDIAQENNPVKRSSKNAKNKSNSKTAKYSK